MYSSSASSMILKCLTPLLTTIFLSSCVTALSEPLSCYSGIAKDIKGNALKFCVGDKLEGKGKIYTYYSNEIIENGGKGYTECSQFIKYYREGERILLKGSSGRCTNGGFFIKSKYDCFFPSSDTVESIQCTNQKSGRTFRLAKEDQNEI